MNDPISRNILLLSKFAHEDELYLLRQTESFAISKGICEPYSVISKQIGLSQIKNGDMIVCSDESRLGSIMDAVKILMKVVEVGAEIITPQIDLRANSKGFKEKKSIIEFLVSVKKRHKSYKIREALWLKNKRSPQMRHKITDEIKKQIISDYKRYKSLRIVAEKYGISRSSCQRIITHYFD